jgi:hypothetical protein
MACGYGNAAPARRHRQEGQASVEFVAVLPVLALGLLIAVQLAVAGYALWSAGIAARAGARAAHVGRDAGRAARRSLPAPLRRGARVSDDDGVEVGVRVPTLIPGLPTVGVNARSALGLGNGDGS